MKKIGIIIFGAAIIVGIVISNLFSFGKMTGKVFNFPFNSGIRGSGNPASETRSVEGFTTVEVGGVFQVEIVAQKDFSVQVEADDNLLEHIKTEVESGILKIETEVPITSQSAMRVRISAPNIERMESSGVSKISIADLKNSAFDLDSSGASKITITGETARLNVQLSGASSLDGAGFTATEADVNVSGASHTSVNVIESLRAEASGASRVNYSGNPKSVEKNSSGASSISQR